MTPVTLKKDDVIRGCLDISATNGYECILAVALYCDGRLCDLSVKKVDTTHDGVFDAYVETEELTVPSDGCIAKLIVLNNQGELKPCKY